jgi:hypothetical protein
VDTVGEGKRIRRLSGRFRVLEKQVQNRHRLLCEARERVEGLEAANADLCVQLEAADVLLGEAMDQALGTDSDR